MGPQARSVRKLQVDPYRSLHVSLGLLNLFWLLADLFGYMGVQQLVVVLP